MKNNIEEHEQPSPEMKKDNNNGIDESEKNQNKLNSPGCALFQNMSNNNQNLFDNNKEIEEGDGTDNLRYKDINYTNNYYPSFQQRLDSCDSQMVNHFKFSIDNPNVPKQRLHEYLNDDLLNALEVSPNIPNLNNGITNNKKMSISNENNDNNDPNNLMGFSLYPQSNTDININNNNNNNSNNLSDINNNNQFININNNNFTNYNNIQNSSNLNYNINNPQIYIPTKLRKQEKKEQIPIDNNNNGQFNVYQKQNQNQDQKKDDGNKTKNKYDKKNAQYNKKDGKNKRHFEVRAGDWTCSKCNNLNFSFRNKCNRCGLPKECNVKFEPVNSDMFNQNKNYQLMNGINPNFVFANNINNVNININNPNGNIKYYPK